MYLSKINFFENFLILKSIFLTKLLHFNIYEFPILEKLEIIFSIFDDTEFTKSRVIILILNFLEDFTGCKPKISNIKILVKNGTIFKCSVFLTKFQYWKFFLFFNTFILTNSLLKFATKKIKLSTFNFFVINLIISDIEFLFDAYSRRFLPNSKYFWLEFKFFFKKQKQHTLMTNLDFYTQLFFCHNIFEWSLK